MKEKKEMMEAVRRRSGASTLTPPEEDGDFKTKVKNWFNGIKLKLGKKKEDNDMQMDEDGGYMKETYGTFCSLCLFLDRPA